MRTTTYRNDLVTKNMKLETIHNLDKESTYMDEYNVYIGISYGGGCYKDQHKIGFIVDEDLSINDNVYIPYILIYAYHPKDPCEMLLHRNMRYISHLPMSKCILRFAEKEVILNPMINEH